MRRLFSPAGAWIAFSLLSALVLAGLTWVTIASLQVESAQQEASLRADRTQKERLALWRMDGLFLPVFGVETNRPYAHYSALHTAFPAVDPEIGLDVNNAFNLRLPSPLLSNDLPNWMALHFQIDPDQGWESPQVLTPELTERLAGPPNWLFLQNVTPERQALLAGLVKRFPKQQVLDQLAQHERRFSLEEPFTVPAPLPPEPSSPKSGEGIGLSESRPKGPPADEDFTRRNMRYVYGPQKPATFNDLAPGFARELMPRLELFAQGNDQRNAFNRNALDEDLLPPGSPLNFGTGGLPNYSGSVGQGGQAGGGRGGANPQSVALANNPNSDFEKRDAITKNLPRTPLENIPGSRGGLNDKANPVPMPATGRAAGPMPTGGGPGGSPGGLPPTNAPPAGGTARTGSESGSPKPTAPSAPVEPTIEAKKVEAPLAKEQPKQAPAAIPQAPGAPSLPPPAPGIASAQVFGQPDRGGARKPQEHRANLLDEPEGMPRRKAEGQAETWSNNDREVRNEPAPVRNHPWANLVAERKSAPAPQPMAVHVGPLRSQWLSAADGTHYLVLVRAARLEAKTVYQGIVLDWSIVQDQLRDVVQDLFPSVNFRRVLGEEAANPEQAMSILPVQLEPSLVPEVAANRWSPLRTGLALAWLAAIVALVAVGFGGRALLELSERRMRFVSAVTHELRTPLTSMRLYLDLLSSGMIEDPDKQREYLTTMLGESERLNQLIENVLDFAKLEKRNLQAHRHQVPVQELVEQLRQTWGNRCQAEGRELVIVSHVPADQMLMTDLRMAGQILSNLIDNARKYSRDSADTRIWLTVHRGANGRVIFDVVDRGPGVPAGEQKRIFRAFHRGHDADAAATGGAGLGLALAKQWTEMLGGTLSYRTPDDGIGAGFRLELPLV